MGITANANTLTCGSSKGGLISEGYSLGLNVLIFCVELRELSHLTRVLSQADKKINVVIS